LSWATTVFTVSAGIAKAMPTEPPDGEHPIADAGLSVRKLHVGEVAAFNLDQRQVRFRVGANDLGRVGLSIIGRDLNLVGLVDHVVVGYRVTICRDEEAGALAGHHAAPLRPPAARQLVAELTEEAVERRARRERQILAAQA
jgi:hypothetical protein